MYYAHHGQLVQYVFAANIVVSTAALLSYYQGWEIICIFKHF